MPSTVRNDFKASKIDIRHVKTVRAKWRQANLPEDRA